MHALPKDCYFDDDLFFEVPVEDKVGRGLLTRLDTTC